MVVLLDVGSMTCIDPLRTPIGSPRSPERGWTEEWSGRGLGGLEVDHQLELGGLLDGQVGWFGALQHFVHIDGGVPMYVRQTWPIGHETPCRHIISPVVHRGQPVRGGEVRDPSAHQTYQRRI